MGKYIFYGVLAVLVLGWAENNKGLVLGAAGAHGAGSALGAAAGGAGGGGAAAAAGSRAAKKAAERKDKPAPTTTTTQPAEDEDEDDAAEYLPVIPQGPTATSLLSPIIPTLPAFNQ
jgi:hypothetical protein